MILNQGSSQRKKSFSEPEALPGVRLAAFSIDRVCINQRDLEERGEQVKRMCYVYREATRIVAWTGESADDSDETIKLIQESGNFAQSLNDGEYNEIIADLDAANTSIQSCVDVLEIFGISASQHTWNALW